MSRYPLRQPPSGWRLVFTAGEGWYVLHGWRLVAGPYTERWYAVQVAERLATQAGSDSNSTREWRRAAMSEQTMYGLTIACERCGHILLSTRVRASRMLPPLDMVPRRHAKALGEAQDRHEGLTRHTCRLRFMWGAKASRAEAWPHEPDAPAKGEG